MPNPVRALTLVVLLAGSLWVEAQTSFIYRGSLQSGGRPASGLFDLRFALTDSTTGNYVSRFVTNQSVQVSQGLFAVTLDFGGEVFDGTPRWLEIAVRPAGERADFTTLAPRQELLPAPYAIHARTAARATDLEHGGALLWNVPASSLSGKVPLDRLTGITSEQIDPVTDRAYRALDTNAVRALIQSTAGQGRITPFDFGARGDGVADDTVALQAWIDAAQDGNLVAELPPAPGFYRISDTLFVRRAGGLTLIGTGGQSHITGGPPYTRSRIHQVTPGKHALLVTNILGSGTPTDNVFLQGFMVTAEHYSPFSHGIAFAGGTPDTDVNVIMNVAARNFGTGLFNASACNLSVISCSFSYCGDGIQLNGPVVNSVLIQSTICTGNRSNGLHVVSAKNVTFDTGDLVTWRSDQAHLATIRSGLVSFRNLNGEHGSPVEAIRIWSVRPEAHVTLDSGMILLFNSPGPNTYSLSISNAGSVVINGALLHARATDGFPIVEYSSPPATTSLRPYPQKVVVHGRVATNWLGNHLRTSLPGLDASSAQQPPVQGGLPHAGLLSVLNQPGNTELLFSAHLGAYNQQGAPVYVPLLQYAKDKLATMTVSNLTVTGTLDQPGAPEGSFAAYPGVITRFTYRNGAINGVRHEEWDLDALQFVQRAGLQESPLEVAAVDQLVKRLKFGNLWSRAEAIYLFRGRNPAAAGMNLISGAGDIEWRGSTLPTFDRNGVTGNGSAFGLAPVELSAAIQFSSGNGSLMAYVGPSDARFSLVAGGQDAEQAFALGLGSGFFADVPGGGIAGPDGVRTGPVVLSHPSSAAGFLLGRSFTNTFSASPAPAPQTRLGILAGVNPHGEALATTSANLRALWLGAGLSVAQAHALVQAFEEYVSMLGIAAP